MAATSGSSRDSAPGRRGPRSSSAHSWWIRRRRRAMSSPTLWLDSNVARSPADIRELVKQAGPKGIRVVVPAQVHLEICRQVRERTGMQFSQQLVDSFLGQLGIDVIE